MPTFSTGIVRPGGKKAKHNEFAYGRNSNKVKSRYGIMQSKPGNRGLSITNCGNAKGKRSGVKRRKKNDQNENIARRQENGVIGHGFSWWDLLAYILGEITIFIVEKPGKQVSSGAHPTL